ncbi:hypothetical protein [Pelagicoccus sp. SDUM812002]|uniref:hypothetical protein n=1 Tax=Pelagicoccus sp. SDUM812002 TaxID=3041266 RepID=UPI00280E8C73|nr:hypothetical protein [Pelagicoccus sp. SDUM812002]MDQ8186300.1 hypothetical protein [Pelagicoccus sp. SDUM812002]
MARLSEEEKREFLEDALSEERRKAFESLRAGTRRRLEPDELSAFLNWAQQFMTEDVSKRGPIRGTKWLL